MEIKICSKCQNQYSPIIDYFSKNNSNNNGFQNQCKNCNKEYRRNNSEKIKNYRLENRDKLIELKKEYRKKYPKKIKEYSQRTISIYNRIKYRAVRKNQEYCSKQEFIIWYENQKKQCVYCDIPLEIIPSLEWGRKKYTNRLTIDRMDNERGYTLNNICLACDICNLTKNSIFGQKEMVEIAQKYIKPKWQNYGK